ncbi:MAG: methytransferase partner Trm112 [Methanospirillum sp.]
MRRSLQEIVCCPVCRGDLELVVTAEDDNGEILEGLFRCAVCVVDYPIEDGIPNLLPPENGGPAEG